MTLLPSTPILLKAQSVYMEQGVPFPPVPSAWAEQIKEVDQGLYSTRTDTPSPYFLEAYLDELEADQVPGYVVFGAAGRGLTSNAMHFYLMTQSVALFLQHPWGNVGAEPTAAIERMQHDYGLAAQILEAVATSTVVKSPQILVVRQSNLRLDSRWALFTPGQGDLIDWHQVSHSTLLETVLNII